MFSINFRNKGWKKKQFDHEVNFRYVALLYEHGVLYLTGGLQGKPTATTETPTQAVH